MHIMLSWQNFKTFLVQDRIEDLGLSLQASHAAGAGKLNRSMIIQIPQQIIFVCASSAFIKLPFFF
jgi:hypothetical protein